MKSDEYWAERMRLLQRALLDKGYDYTQNFEKQFALSRHKIEQELEAWYSRFAKNNEISLSEARKLLTSGELKELRWTVEEYIKYGKENALDGRWMKELENASARVHISRLEGLKLQIRQEVELLYGGQPESLARLLSGIYESGLYRTAFEIQKGVGLGCTLTALNENALSKVLARPWTTDGKTFRDRCWTNREALVRSLNTNLTQMIIRGEAPDRAIAAISREFDVSKRKAGRLVMTESAAFSSAAQRDCFNELGVEYFRILENLDGKTCEACGELDGKVLKMSEFEVGLSAPPFHPRCRGCTAPHFDDMGGERIARGADGKSYKVPADMTYKEWYEKTVSKPAEMRYNTFRQTVDADYKRYATAQNATLQNRHIEGAKNYDPTRGALTMAPQELYDLYSGKGTFIQANAGKWTEKERFTHSADIGIYRSKRTGRECVTNCGIIHYSKKKGWHIVPARPQKGSASK